MPIVDSHCHVSLAWYEPVESLLSQMDRNGVECAVLVQIYGQFNNSYQMDCIRRYPGRFASVVAVDPESPSAADDLRQHADEGASGVRLKPTTRSKGADPLAIWKAAAQLGLAVSCYGTAMQFASPEFALLVESLPGLPIALEHLASGNTPNANGEECEARLQAFELSRFPNVFIKVPGLGEICRRAMPVAEPFPFELPIPTLMEDAYRAFGPDRMMWGSDFPPVSRREGYANALSFAMEQFASKASQERAKIFGGTALSVFPLRV